MDLISILSQNTRILSKKKKDEVLNDTAIIYLKDELFESIYNYNILHHFHKY